MLETLITSRTRIKLMTKFFLNPRTKAYLRELERSFDESCNAVRLELNRFEESGLLRSSLEGNRKIFMANTNHPLFQNIHSMLLINYGIDRILDEITVMQGDTQQVWLGGELARGNESEFIDLLLVGTTIDQEYSEQLTLKTESLTNRKIRITIFSPGEFAAMQNKINSTDIFLMQDSQSLV